jgi:hypothetical protein
LKVALAQRLQRAAQIAIVLPLVKSKIPIEISLQPHQCPDWCLLEAMQQRLDANPQAMRQRRETVEHPFGTMKARMGATHFLTKTLPKVAAEKALSVLAYNLTRVMNIVGIMPLMARSQPDRHLSLGCPNPYP